MEPPKRPCGDPRAEIRQADFGAVGGDERRLAIAAGSLAFPASARLQGLSVPAPALQPLDFPRYRTPVICAGRPIGEIKDCDLARRKIEGAGSVALDQDSSRALRAGRCARRLLNIVHRCPQAFAPKGSRPDW